MAKQLTTEEVDALMASGKGGSRKSSYSAPAKPKKVKKDGKNRPNPHKYRSALGSGLAGRAMDLLAKRRQKNEPKP
jgi:hypothetical protein